MFEEDINGSVAHCKMIGKQNIIPLKDSNLIIKTLMQIKKDIIDGKIIIENAEDIHMFIEQILTERIGDIGKRLHTARSRNDQVALDTRMFCKKSIEIIISKLKTLVNVFTDMANKHLDTIMPAFTHLQKAQPTTLAHYLMAYGEMFYRDILRFKDTLARTDYMPLGSGALCTSTYNIDREFVKKELGFKNVTPNSLDAVSDRDYVLEFLFNTATTMMHLSRINEELIIWVSNDYSYCNLDDAFSTGSSIMPQKKNPDICELIRGKTGRTYGNLMNLLTVMKGIPLAYNKDMQEDKESLFDSQATIEVCLDLFAKMLPTMKFNKETMYESAKKGHMAATDVADYLVKKGLPFRNAHEVAGKAVLFCVNNNKTLEDLSLKEYKTFSNLFSNDIYDAIKLQTLVANRKVQSGPNKECVKKEITDLINNIKKI
ncbi:argininosuccinate lyase [Bacilli bacterium]|nr:argininosuccinate lyase [Bacilli bacterium]